MTRYRSRLPQIGLPKRVLDLASDLEIGEIYSMEEESHKWPSRHLPREDYQSEVKKVYLAREGLRALRKVLRLRYSNNMENGLYTTNSKETYCKISWGKYGLRYGGHIPKGGVMTWLSRDELGNNWFMWEKSIITITGIQLQKVIKLKEK